jgi:hypothetical protein
MLPKYSHICTVENTNNAYARRVRLQLIYYLKHLAHFDRGFSPLRYKDKLPHWRHN